MVERVWKKIGREDMTIHNMDNGMIIKGRFNMEELSFIVELANGIKEEDDSDNPWCSSGWFKVEKEPEDNELKIWRQVGEIKNWKKKVRK